MWLVGENNKDMKIKILKNGPYMVTGNVPLSETIIVPKGKGYEYKEGCTFPEKEQYALCRCGKSKNPPFCDGAHAKEGFDGTETASKAKYEERAELIKGPDLDLMDDGRCALGRFCHLEDGSVWQLVKKSDVSQYREQAIKGASECPAGRLVAIDKSGKVYEDKYEPSIEFLQDPEKGVSCGIFVKGNIPIESSDGEMYETRNRVMLCRCGESSNKPFCDATHVRANYLDQE